MLSDRKEGTRAEGFHRPLALKRRQRRRTPSPAPTVGGKGVFRLIRVDPRRSRGGWDSKKSSPQRSRPRRARSIEPGKV